MLNATGTGARQKNATRPATGKNKKRTALRSEWLPGRSLHNRQAHGVGAGARVQLLKGDPPRLDWEPWKKLESG